MHQSGFNFYYIDDNICDSRNVCVTDIRLNFMLSDYDIIQAITMTLHTTVLKMTVIEDANTDLVPHFKWFASEKDRERESVCVCSPLWYVHGCMWMCIRRGIPVGNQIISWDKTKSIWRVRQSPQGAGHQRPTTEYTEGERWHSILRVYVCVCVCVFVRERGRERKRMLGQERARGRAGQKWFCLLYDFKCFGKACVCRYGI